MTTAYGNPANILAQVTARVIYTTGKHLFLGWIDKNIIRPLWTNPKSIPENLRDEWNRLTREKGLKVWDAKTKKWVP